MAVTQDPGTATPVRRLALMALMCLVLGALGGVLAATATHKPSAATRFIPPREHAYDFSLRDERGHRTSLADARGKVIAMTFIYSTCHDLCPAEGNDIAQAMDQVGPGVEAYIVSVDPVGDTPARARVWMDRRHLTGRGHYLVGTRDELRPVWVHYGIAPLQATPREAAAEAAQVDKYLATHPKARNVPYRAPAEPAGPAPRSGDAYPDPSDLSYRGRARHEDGWAFEHSAYVLLIDKHGVQRLGIPFEALSPSSLADDMRALLREPSS